MPRKLPGKAISIWMSVAERAEYRRICAAANHARSGPQLSRSFIVRALLKAYGQGLDVPGLPAISLSDNPDNHGSK